jgi:glucose-6-phosphate isomerase
MKYQRSANSERGDEGGRDRGRATEYAATMRAAMSDKAYSLPEASLRLPFDSDLYEKSRVLASQLAGPKLNYVVNIGIGGSYLGTKAVYEAIFGALDAHSPFAPKMLFADTCSPELLSDITEIVLNEITVPDEVIIIVASKSGTTTETIVNASVLVSALEQKFGSMAKRIVCITDEGSTLWKLGEKQGFHLLPIPKMVGGRYSVFSPIGVFPLLCVGLEVDRLLKGAQEMVHNCVERGAESDAYRAAEDMLGWNEKGVMVFDMFLFQTEFESLGKWYRQLFAESLGKEMTNEGTPSTHRMVPTVSIGSTDLHSVEQMHLAFPNLIARTLVRVNAPHWEHEFLASDRVFAPLVPGVAGARHAILWMQSMKAKRHIANEASFVEVELPYLAL